MEAVSLPQLLIIAGTGRNTGKTTLACNIIRKYSPLKSITAIKITPHFHKNIQSGKIIMNNSSCYIADETSSATGKDSSLMLEAGATKSLFVMATDEYLDQVLGEILKLIPSDGLMVCESGGLRNHVIPGLFLMMKNSKTIDLKAGADELLQLADRVITLEDGNIDFDFNSVEVTDNRWTLKQN